MCPHLHCAAAGLPCARLCAGGAPRVNRRRGVAGHPSRHYPRRIRDWRPASARSRPPRRGHRRRSYRRPPEGAGLAPRCRIPCWGCVRAVRRRARPLPALGNRPHPAAQQHLGVRRHVRCPPHVGGPCRRRYRTQRDVLAASHRCLLYLPCGGGLARAVLCRPARRTRCGVRAPLGTPGSGRLPDGPSPGWRRPCPRAQSKTHRDRPSTGFWRFVAPRP
mmetsp:Transcript_9110/g.30197  ORF Transcript_9110/g.30197 Transcript_9110/m.30197 type:complete len:219 (+) Transcript_9110:684-1340(+)